MRKTNLGSKMVKKAITWAMVMTMSLSTAMSSFATMTAYAKPAGHHEEHRKEEHRKEEYKEEQKEEKEEEKQEEVQSSEGTQDSNEQGSSTSTETEIEIEVTETTEKSEEIYLDGEQVADNTETEGNELDHTKVETVVKDVKTSYVIESTSTDQAIVGTTADGETVEKIEVDAENLEVKEVLVIEKETEQSDAEDATIEETVAEASEKSAEAGAAEKASDTETTATIVEVSEEDVIYGYFEDGAFVEGTADDGKSRAYTETDGTYKETTTVNKVNGIDSETGEEKEYYVNDEVVDVLNGEEVEGYEKKTVYYVGEGEDKVEIAEEELEERLDGTFYEIDEETGVLTVKVEKEEKEKSRSEGYGHKPGKNGNRRKEESYYIVIDGEKVTVDSDKVETKTVYQVVDDNNNVLCEVDATTVENIAECIETKNYTKVNEMYVVKDEEDKDVYFTPQEWEMVVSQEVTYQEVTEYYYVSEDNYENKALEITSEGKDYLLDVAFWDSEYVKLDGSADTAISYTEDENGNIVVNIKYLYAEEFEVDADSEWKSGVYTKTISKEEFGISRMATLTVKYTPTLTKTEEVTFDAVLRVEETTQKQEGVSAITSSVVANDGEPVNEKPTNNKTYNHVDVLTDTKVTIGGKEVSATVSGVTVTVDGESIAMSQYATTDPQRYTEYRSVNNRNLGINNSDFVTITAKVTYPYEGKEYTFDYVVKVYPNNDEHNHCQDAHKDGFDYQITSTELQAAIQEDIVNRSYSVEIEEDKKVEESGNLGDAAEEVADTEVTAKVFVRLDNEKQVENGNTHYDSADYTKDLAAKYSKTIYLAYTKSGFAVHDENIPANSTAAEEINKKLGNTESVNSEERLKALADLYMQNDKLEQLAAYVESDEFEEQLAQEVAKQQGEDKDDYNWTYQVGTKSYDNYEDAFKAAQELTVSLTVSNGNGVNWYVLKSESDGWHIDGVSKIMTVGIKAIKGQPVPVESPSAAPSESPSAAPSESPSAAPSESPSAAPTQTPAVETSVEEENTPDDEEDDVTQDEGDDTPEIVTIEDEGVPMAAVPVQDAPAAIDVPVADAPAVLGAVREADAEVLGATRGTDYAVLGKRRRPETGDSMAVLLWAMSALTGAGTAGISGAKLLKGRKKQK